MPLEWEMVGKKITTADNAAAVPVVYQQFNLPATKRHSLLHGVGLWIVIHDAAFTALSVELWSDRSGAPGKLIATSTTSWTKVAIDALYPLDYKALFLGFGFTPVPIRKSVDYHFALRATGYTGNDANHVAWLHAYPEAPYTDGLGFTIEAKKAAVVPLFATVFAAEM